MSRTMRLARHVSTTLRANPMRTLLLMSGMMVGVAVLAAVIILGQGTRGRILDLVGKHGLDMIMVRAGGDAQVFAPTADRGLASLMEGDVRAIEREVPGVRILSGTQNLRGISVVAGDRQVTTRAFGVEPDWMAVRRWGMAEGEFLDATDMAATARVVMLGAGVARQLFPNGGAVGETIRVNGDPYVVKGVFIEMGTNAGGDDWDDRIVVPMTTSARRLFNRPYLEQIVMLVDDARRVPEVAERVRDLLRVRHNIGPGQPDDFFVREPEDIEDAALDTSNTLTTLLVALAGVALLAGALVIMNLMVASVTARRHEIGLRRAVGARAADIERQFLLEAVGVSLGGGLVGLVLGVSVALLIGVLGLGDTRLTWLPFAAALVACVAIGLAAGVIPARRAAQVPAAVALRERR
jgi:putative ABC transport system permease protein